METQVPVFSPFGPSELDDLCYGLPTLETPVTLAMEAEAVPAIVHLDALDSAVIDFNAYLAMTTDVPARHEPLPDAHPVARFQCPRLTAVQEAVFGGDAFVYACPCCQRVYKKGAHFRAHYARFHTEDTKIVLGPRTVVYDSRGQTEARKSDHTTRTLSLDASVVARSLQNSSFMSHFRFTPTATLKAPKR